jgi:hypothetical protein
MATPLSLVGRLFRTNLIVLEGQGIDVILGMGWMKRCKAVLDIAARTVHLESPTRGSVFLKLPPPTSIASALHHIAAQNLGDVPVACEFPDVFPEDPSLSLVFWSNNMSVWAPILSEAQPITPRQTNRWSESIKSSKICSILVF